MNTDSRNIEKLAESIISQVGDAPLTLDADRVIRIGRTRVTLDIVIATFLAVATAEEIVEDYSTLDLADVYLVLGFYLRHRELVDQYIEERNRIGEAMEKEIRRRQKNGSLREKLMQRVAAKARNNG